MVSLRNLVMVTLFCCVSARTAQGLELKLLAVSSGPDMAQGFLKRAISISESGSKPTPRRMAKGLKTRIFNAHAAIGRGYLRRPIALDLSVSAKPDLSVHRLKVERRVDFSASKPLLQSVPLSLEARLKQTETSEGVILLLLKFEI